ncbi:MFS family permease [Bradyrhizobium sp. USDA 4532]|uniref:MFS transporter n=1 Tax=Bradyrhizobium TaxID=374 RepID=UPI0014570BDD|nr:MULTISPECIES: MFS transporter [Bradyrhizobium]MCP1914370.1 MFS family permease [Bradyrhizobium elkanii]MCP1831526.1 MFS family permease [Bradyrhizobium sp. USDA 4545]MCP1850441.1 MFS family permease [Bradyrhizobium sp. USDA 4541]MCP1924637.1 MFS family permease [Bradyrhizobium sp. USDA 4532]NLS69119.1 MFS transporter [Bradyrhizobium brasilense]
MSMLGQQAVYAPTSRFTDRAYLAWTAVAIAYAIAFLQRVSPQSVSLSFMHDFNTDAAGVAMLASSYFWGYTLMQIPAGLLVDRYGVKRVVLVSMIASSLGSAAFALAPNLLDVFVARLIVACGDALVFTALLKLVAQSFADERFGMMSGISQVSGYVGGVIATTPLAAAVSGFGWRACFLFIACIGLANLAFAKLALKPDPASHSNKTLKGVVIAARQSLAHVANWGCAMTFASHFAVVTTLSGVWGIPMVAHFFHISPTAAGTPLLAFMIGNALGSIFLGHAADRAAAALDRALIGICVLRMLLIAMLLPPIAQTFGLAYVTVAFTALGLVAGGTVPLVLKCVKKLYTADLIGVGASVNTTAAGIFAGISQPIIGFAMLAASNASGTDAVHNTAAIGDGGYSALIVILLLMSLPGIAGPLLMRSKLIAR